MRTFMIDHREKSEYFKLRLTYALETLEVIDEAISRLNEHSRIDSSMVAGVLRKERARLVHEDAAYFEAAAIAHVGIDWFTEASNEKV